MTAAIEVEDVSKVFVTRRKRETKGVMAVKDVNITIKQGEFICFIGPSGCGKTTVLNMIAGSEVPTDGSIRCLGKKVEGLQTGIGYVTQEDTLLPWRTLRSNVELGLEFRRENGQVVKDLSREYISKVGLDGFESHYPHQLSGGMQKRATLIRTLIMQPEVVLMDEPFGALDSQTRLVLQNELLNLWSASGSTVVFVTHDVVEAITLADRIICFGRRPGHVSREISVDIPRPRDAFFIHDAEGFAKIYQEVLKQVHEADGA